MNGIRPPRSHMILSYQKEHPILKGQSSQIGNWVPNLGEWRYKRRESGRDIVAYSPRLSIRFACEGIFCLLRGQLVRRGHILFIVSVIVVVCHYRVDDLTRQWILEILDC